MVRVKICGITNLADARGTIVAGADALGFVFYKKSPRYIAPQQAACLIRKLPRKILKVGVFVNSRESYIRKVARQCGLDLLQFHGQESPAFCRRFARYRVIKDFRVKDKIGRKDILRYKVFAYLFDAFSPAKFGGTGKRFNWRLLRDLGKIKRPVFLSGGLNARNVRQAIRLARPDWIDVSSSVEASPGKKDAAKLRAFINKVGDV
jgi:phosphoribosylanthranilate isomerase